MKKILSLVLAMLMIFSMVPAVFAADASESDYQAAIDYLKTIELYKGTGDSDAADELVERYQMALFTARMVTGRVDKAYWETDENDSGFTDLEGLNEEALGGVSYAAQQGIVNGIGGGEFAPFDNVTYRDAIVMIVRALGFNYPASGYPWSYINKARELGVLDGISGVTYTVEVKREVIAQLLYNALNAEIKGATLAETAFGVAETIVMVTATTDIAYGKAASKAVKANYVKVAALDAEGEPFGTEYYVPYKDLGLTAATANAAVGTTYAVTHKDNFTKVLASESLSKVFENTVDKKEVTYTFDGKIVLGKAQYTILASNAGYTNLNNNQGTVTGTKEIKVFKAFGAKAENLIPADAKYLMGADGNIYDVTNPFKPYAYYSALINAYFTYDATTGAFTKLSDTEADALLALTTTTVEGFSNIGADAYAATKISKDYGAPYDYFKAIASDINGDGTYDRVIIRPYELFRLTAKSSDGKKATLQTYTAPVNGAGTSTTQEITIADWRQTGLNLSTVSAGNFFVAYMADGVAKERELEIVEVVKGAKADEEDTTYVFSAYLRGYDATTNSVIFGSNYETLPFGYFGVINTTAYVPAQSGNAAAVAATTSATANFLRQYWNTYVTMHVLNGKIIMVEAATDADNYVIVESFTDFSENGLKAIAYSTLADGKAEITISELNGWNLGGFDYDLYQWLKQLADAGLNVADYPLPIELNTVYKVRYVAEDGSYNLVAAAPYAVDEDIYVNNFGYILGVDANGVFASDKRVATADKDLWIILQGDKVHMFKGKLSTVELYDLDFYKAKGNQFVAVADATTNLGPIYGNVNQGVDYWLYNKEVDKYYNQNFYGQFVYGHFMTNMRTGAVEFITYDSALAQKEFTDTYVPMVEGGIYKATDKVLKTKDLYSMKEVAATEFASGKYFGKNFATYTVGAGLAADFNQFDHPALVAVGATKHYVSFEALMDAIAINMYEEIYDRDFTNTDVNVDSWEAIKKELMSKVLFVDRTADNKRTQYYGYANNAYAAKTIGSAGSVVPAYVMYDYANNAATVYFDSREVVDLNVVTKVPTTIAGVAAEITYGSNVLTNTTEVIVDFGGKYLEGIQVTVDGAHDNLFVNPTGVYYTVADATYTGVPTITATKTLTKVSADKITAVKSEGHLADVTAAQGLVDGVYHTSDNVNEGDVNLSFKGFAANAYDANLKQVGGQTKPGALYYSFVAFELDEATAVKKFRLCVNNYAGDGNATSSYKKLDFAYQGVAVLVSADGETWEQVAVCYDMVNGEMYFDVKDAIRNYCAADIDLTNTDAVKYVAFACTGAEKSYNDKTNPTRGLPQYGSGAYAHAIEIELFY